MAPTSDIFEDSPLFNCEEYVYKEIHCDPSGLCKDIFLTPLWNDLVRIGFIPAEICPFEIEGLGSALRHKRVPFISYASEWSSSMLKDAALLVCAIQMRLLESGYTLQHAHSWDVIFDGCEPRYVAISNISEKSPTALTSFLRDFRHSYLNPLLLKHAKLSHLINAAMSQQFEISNAPIMRILFFLIPMREWIYHYKKRFEIDKWWHRSPEIGIKYLRQQVAAISDAPEPTEWSHYCDDYESYEENPDATAKISAVKDLLDRLRPRSVLDIGSNTGFYSKVAAIRGARVISADIDEFSINELYHRGKLENLNIYPVCVDVLSGIAKQGPHHRCAFSLERFRSEMVMMLGLVHHLVQKRGAAFDDITQIVSALAEKFALIEFVGPTDKHLVSWDKIQGPSYSLNIFINALTKYFQKAEVYRQVHEDRWLIFCTKG